MIFYIAGQSAPTEKAKLRFKEPDASVSRMTKCHHILSLFLLISPYLINGAPTTAPVSLPADDALSTYYCSDSPAWSGPSFYPKDCTAAMAQFFLQELLVHGDVLFEFLAVGARQRTRYPPQNMPEKFTYGKPTCV